MDLLGIETIAVGVLVIIDAFILWVFIIDLATRPLSIDVVYVISFSKIIFLQECRGLCISGTAKCLFFHFGCKPSSSSQTCISGFFG